MGFTNSRVPPSCAGNKSLIFCAYKAQRETEKVGERERETESRDAYQIVFLHKWGT